MDRKDPRRYQPPPHLSRRSRSIRRRPDIGAQYATWRQNAEQARVAYSKIWPSLMLQATAGTDFQNIASDNFEPGNYKRTDGFGRTGSFGVAIMLSWSIFDGFNLVNTYKAAQETTEAARANMATTELNAISDLVANIVNYKNSQYLYVQTETLLLYTRSSIRRD